MSAGSDRTPGGYPTSMRDFMKIIMASSEGIWCKAWPVAGAQSEHPDYTPNLIRFCGCDAQYRKRASWE